MSNTVTGIIILAADSSFVMDGPKQNLIFRDQTLLQRAIETALSTISETIVVVLGANADVIIPTINNPAVNIIQNTDWATGTASSIKLGITTMQQINPVINSVILMSFDQPFNDTYILNMLMLVQPKSGIAACGYNNIAGLPVLFDKVYFEELLMLKENEDTEKILAKHGDAVTIIPFEQGGMGINDIEDFG